MNTKEYRYILGVDQSPAETTMKVMELQGSHSMILKKM